ncbi:GIY-YIG nuclease family protein [Lyngbya confervoides]|uniref:GIY-YIG nuclease family protein n=1 Tax=Lyngbya confervoides BDU141951 TaxID=1574623 RepID=A0ABD4T232_9CYAN|nr:GIY-YIG nuclease family protein [Lyngbya confervoides]MCM1982649.1 GIY-YIG nuclease family protein [Lyngbya confervoides BDU141951]
MTVSLQDLAYLPYIDDQGYLPQALDQKIGAYVIFDQHQSPQHLGYSRNVRVSLKQHLVRQPLACHWVKATMIDRPSKRDLEAQVQAWLEEIGRSPYSQSNPQSGWIEAIQVKERLTSAEQAILEVSHLDERGKIRATKQIARRIEADILGQLSDRGLREKLRFNPKLKELGILDIQ